MKDVEEVQEVAKKKRGRPKKPDEEKVVKVKEPGQPVGRPRKPESVFNNTETRHEYHKLYYLEKLKDNYLCHVCHKNLNSIIALKHHYTHNLKCQVMRYKTYIETLLHSNHNMIYTI